MIQADIQVLEAESSLQALSIRERWSGHKWTWHGAEGLLLLKRCAAGFVAMTSVAHLVARPWCD
jgi:hypothetical protein